MSIGNALLAFALPLLSAGVVAQWPAQTIDIYPLSSASRESATWDLQVHNGTQWVQAGVYEFARAPYPGFGSSQDGIVTNYGVQHTPPQSPQLSRVSWATLGLSHSARVKAIYTGNVLGVLSALPGRYELNPVVSGNTIEFTIKVGQKVYLSLGSEVEDCMILLANPAEPSPQRGWVSNPATIPPNVHCFMPGEHLLSPSQFVLPGGKDTVYLAPGAWVKGTIRVDSASVPAGSVTKVIGPGVLSGELTSHDVIRAAIGQPNGWDTQVLTSMIYSSHVAGSAAVHGVVVDGPTIVAAPFMGLYLSEMLGSKAIRNVHYICPWNYNSDAFPVGCNATIENCFALNNDDTIHAEYSGKGGPVSVRNCVFAGRTPFLVGYGYFDGSSSAWTTVESCDVVRMLSDEQGTAGVFAMLLDGDPNTVIQNEVFRDIRVHGPVWRLFNLRNTNTPWGYDPPADRSAGDALGNARNLLFENIQVVDAHPNWKSVVTGKDQHNFLGYIEFRNLVIPGPVASPLPVRIDGNNWWTYFFDVPDFSRVSWNFF